MATINVVQTGFVTLVLKDGTEVHKLLACSLVIMLEHLIRNNQLLFLDIVMTARGMKPILFQNSIPYCYRELRIASHDGKLTPAARAVVLNTVEGDGTAMRLVSPWKESEEDVS